jgi:outer membrane immunogenic protein
MIGPCFESVDGSGSMRRVLLAAAMLAMSASAQAADMPDFLRGSLPGSSTPTRNWDGWYAGGQVEYSTANVDYGSTVVSMTNNLFRNTTLQGATSSLTLLGRTNAQTTSGFGAFVGRNYQFADIVLGVEANYNYYASSFGSSTSASLGPIQVAEPGLILPAGDTAVDGVSLNGNAALQVKDELTFRGRAGWATGDFLPYAFGGLAVGRMDVTRTVTSSVERTIYDSSGGSNSFSLPQFALTTTDARSNNFALGWTAGLGVEYMVWDNLFVRGEWEYIKFMQVMGTSVAQNNARFGIGYKF